MDNSCWNKSSVLQALPHCLRVGDVNQSNKHKTSDGLDDVMNVGYVCLLKQRVWPFGPQNPLFDLPFLKDFTEQCACITEMGHTILAHSHQI